MENANTITYTAFAGATRIASGALADVAGQVRQQFGPEEAASVAIFDDLESRPIDLDWRGTLGDVLSRLIIIESERSLTADADAVARGRGRPKLGVVAREVTLLPRHWDWLSGQPGGASVALRKLVEAARHEQAGADNIRRARDSAYRFISAMAGNQPGFEEATRALFAGDATGFADHSDAWPQDLREHARRLAAPGFGEATQAA